MNLKVTFKVKDRETTAELLKATKNLELNPTVGTEGMDDVDVGEAFRVLDLISAEFRSDPMSVQCFASSIVSDANRLARRWNDKGRP